MLLMLSVTVLLYVLLILVLLWIDWSANRKGTRYVLTSGFGLLMVNAVLALLNYQPTQQPIDQYMALIHLLAVLAFLVGAIVFNPLVSRGHMILASHGYLLESMRDTYYRASATGEILLISASCETLLGYSSEEMTGRKLAEFWEDLSDREPLLAALTPENDTVEDYQAWLTRNDGGRVLVEFNARRLRNATGEVVGIEGVLRNITDRTRRDSQITELGRIIETSAHEIYVFDADTLMFLTVNRGARENTGYRIEDLTSMTVHALRPPDSALDLEAILGVLKRGEESVVRIEGSIQRKDGSLYSADISFQYSTSRLQPVFFVFAEESTMRKQAEAEQVKSQRLQSLGHLTGGVAHDFNNMLQALQLNLENIVPADKDQARWHKGAGRVIDHAAQLTQRLLTVTGRQTLAPQVLDVDVVLETLSLLFKLTLTQAINLKLELGTESQRIKVDEAQFESSLLNLVLNARDAMKDGGNLLISSRRRQLSSGDGVLPNELADGEYVELCITDDGAGMSEETARNALEAFFTTKNLGEGTGLGLVTADVFVKQSGGHMSLHSVPDKGTTVQLLLPVSYADIAVASEPSIRREITRDALILLIEDDPVISELIGTSLQEHGYRVLIAVNAQSAEQMAAAHSGEVDAIVADVLLADGDSGPDVVEKIGQIQGPIPTLFMSGHTLEYWSRIYQFPDQSVLLQKPFKQERLFECIEEMIDGSKIPEETKVPDTH